MKRILIIGTSGCGKSTLAGRLSGRLRLPFFPTDNFYWQPGWKAATQDQVRQQVRDVVAQDTWILDGNFDEMRELVWKQADCIVWLDYSLLTILKQVAVRNFGWVLTRQQAWSGNKMTLARAISGIQHAIGSYPQKKRKYPSWLSEISGVPVCRFRTRQATELWFQGLKS